MQHDVALEARYAPFEQVSTFDPSFILLLKILGPAGSNSRYSNRAVIFVVEQSTHDPLVAGFFDQGFQMSFGLRCETVSPLHRRSRRLVQRQVEAPEHVRNCQVELCVCETRREQASVP